MHLYTHMPLDTIFVQKIFIIQLIIYFDILTFNMQQTSYHVLETTISLQIVIFPGGSYRFFLFLFSSPSLSHSSDTESTSLSRCSGLLPKFAISAEVEDGEGSLSLEDPSKVTFSIGELPQEEPDPTTPCSTISNSTLSGTGGIYRRWGCILYASNLLHTKKCVILYFDGSLQTWY